MSLPGHELPACQGCGQALLVSSSQSVTLRGFGESTRICILCSWHPTSAAWKFTVMFTGVKVSISWGKVTSLPKANVLPGPLDGSLELLVPGCDGLQLSGVGSFPVAAIPKHQLGSLNLSGAPKSGNQGVKRAKLYGRILPCLFQLLWFAGHGVL